MDKRNLHVFTNGNKRIDETTFEVVERKGIGHPDTLCDSIAEKISRAYSQYCLEHFGTILRHMVDKIALSGGASKVMFGGGEMQKPIKLYLNCRFTRTHQQETVPYLEIVNQVVRDHFSEVMPLLDSDNWLVIVDNTHFAPGPGVVYENDGSTKNERRFFFEVPKREFAIFHDNSLRANDTSTAVGYSPLSKTVNMAILVEKTLNSPNFKKTHPYVGTDIRVMVKRIKEKVDATACIPFIACHTPSKEFYFQKLEELNKTVLDLLEKKFPEFDFQVFLNTRDNPGKSDYYLTLTGSAIESGDEGVVGRGNRYNGVIPFNRRMSMEACCGKNPVYHVGKIYTAICSLISQDIHNLTGLESYVFLTSQMGRSLSDPWLACVEVCCENISDEHIQLIEEAVERRLSNTPETTRKIISGEIELF